MCVSPISFDEGHEKNALEREIKPVASLSLYEEDVGDVTSQLSLSRASQSRPH